MLNLAASLPEYKKNIQSKVSILRSDPDGSLNKARRTIEEISTEISKRLRPRENRRRGCSLGSADSGDGGGGAADDAAVHAEVVTLLVIPLTVAGAVLLFTFIMLLRREDLRDRLIRLVGHGQLNVTTQVFEEAASRVSRYLRVQLIVNVSYGVPVGLALAVLGIPNAVLWGLLATALRFIPYIGAWIAAAMPIAIAFAIADGWSLVLWTVAVFLVLELISNNVIEPWVYGASTGMSALAVSSPPFSGRGWGAIGLLLAIPLTVCLVVIGRYVPQLAFLSIMLGDQPVLPLQDRFYQRLLARDQEEATELAEAYVIEHGLEALYEDVLIPVLDLAERDRHSDALSEDRKVFVFDSLRSLIEDLSERPAPADDKAADKADEKDKAKLEADEGKPVPAPEAAVGPH